MVGACMAGGVCMTGGMHSREHVWLGHVWQGACVVGSVCDSGACVGDMCG